MSRAAEFFYDYAMPFVDEWRIEPSDRRLAFAAAMFLSHTGDWYVAENPGISLTQLEADRDYRLIRAIADAAKHRNLRRRRTGTRLSQERDISSANEVTTSSYMPRGYFARGYWAPGYWLDGTKISLGNGATRDFATVVDAVVCMWVGRLGPRQ
jgi:hypothetical protein